ncbi:MAG: ubiquinone/menaquinone biosynthesis methyltransferase [Bacteroidales bacterium]
MTDPAHPHPLQEFYEDIHGTYDRVNRVFTFGRDRSWRRKAARECLEGNPERVLDLCTGTGDFVLEMKDRLPDARFTGFDFSAPMLDVARKKLARRSAGPNQNVEFVEGDAGDMPFPDGHFDAAGITFGIRNLIYENPAASRHLSEMNRVIRPGGRLVILESSRPKSLLWRGFNDLYLRFVLPSLGGILSGNRKAYTYLARSSRNYYTMEEMGRILETHGFHVVKQLPLFLGSVMLLVVRKNESLSLYLSDRSH